MTDTSIKPRHTKSSRKQLNTKSMNKPTSTWSFDDNHLKKALDTWENLPNDSSLNLNKASTTTPQGDSVDFANTRDIKDLLETIKKKLSELD